MPKPDLSFLKDAIALADKHLDDWASQKTSCGDHHKQYIEESKTTIDGAKKLIEELENDDLAT